jgi:membrane-associated protease RseP (regulator of RpoE activity)
VEGQSPPQSPQEIYSHSPSSGKVQKRIPQYLIPLGLFVLTFFTTTIAGVFWLNKDGFDLENFQLGLTYSFCILFVLASHEFGHYFAARHHKVEATLPFFIPAPPVYLPFGTLGAVIRTRSPVPTRKAMFDIGVAGPIAGFVATIIVLLIGLTNLPPKEYIYTIHPEYLQGMKAPGADLTFGNTLLYTFLEKSVATGYVPPMDEIYHYPFLCVGWFGLLVTAMNLIPVGQLDGGHIIYGMFGQKHRIIARSAFVLLLVLGLAGALQVLRIELSFGWSGWLVWAAILFIVIKLDHPQIADPEPLSPNRMIVGWIALAIFVVSFSPSPINIPL